MFNFLIAFFLCNHVRDTRGTAHSHCLRAVADPVVLSLLSSCRCVCRATKTHPGTVWQAMASLCGILSSPSLPFHSVCTASKRN